MCARPSAQERALLLRNTILPQSRQTFDVSRAAYQTDRVDFQAVIDDRTDAARLAARLLRALSEFEQAMADLERAVGTELPKERSDGRGRPIARARWCARLAVCERRHLGVMRAKRAQSPPDAGARHATRAGGRQPRQAAADAYAGASAIDPRRQQLIGVRTVPAATDGLISHDSRGRRRAVRRDEASRRQRQGRRLDSRSLRRLHGTADSRRASRSSRSTAPICSTRRTSTCWR